MNVKGHSIGGGIYSLIATAIPAFFGWISIKESIIFMAMIFLGSNFSDIDTESVASKIYAFFASVLSVYFWYTGNPVYILFILAPYFAAKIGKHRGWTHSYWLPTVIIFLPIVAQEFILLFQISSLKNIYYLIHKYKLVYSGFAIGIVCHLYLDSKEFKKIAIKMGWSK